MEDLSMALLSAQSLRRTAALIALSVLAAAALLRPTTLLAQDAVEPAPTDDPALVIGGMGSTGQTLAAARPTASAPSASVPTSRASARALPLSEPLGPFRNLGLFLGGVLVLAALVAGIALTVSGLKDDLRKKKRRYRRRARGLHVEALQRPG